MYKINEQKLTEYIVKLKREKMYIEAMKKIEIEDLKKHTGYWLWNIVKK
jgi:hypothetical protein